MRFSLFAAVALLVALTLMGRGQAVAQASYRVEVEQTVSSNELLLDFYITRLTGDTIWLAASNFSVYLNDAALDLAAAQLDHSLDGRWDDSYDPAGYNDLSVRTLGDFLTFSVNCRSQFKSLNPGRGQAVHLRRERMGRVRVPIRDSCGQNALTWRLPPMGVMNWDAGSIKGLGEFVTPSAPVLLCETPTQPTVTPQTPLAVCASNPARLWANTNGTVQWFRDGVLMPGATSPELVVTQSGRYAAYAFECTCQSAWSDTFNVDVAPSSSPRIWYGPDGRLHTDSTQALQWYLDGKPIVGATGGSVPVDKDGTYTVRLTNRCGSFLSTEFVWYQYRELLDPYALAASAPTMVVHPNPYVGSTQLSYTLPKDAEVTIELTTGMGAVVKKLLHERQRAGKYSMRFTGREHGLTPGTYFLSFRAGEVNKTFKVVEVQ